MRPPQAQLPIRLANEDDPLESDIDIHAAPRGKRTQRIHLLSGPSLDVSSSEIRARVAAGHSIRYLVPRAVEELIVERGLYRAGRHG